MCAYCLWFLYMVIAKADIFSALCLDVRFFLLYLQQIISLFDRTEVGFALF